MEVEVIVVVDIKAIVGAVDAVRKGLKAKGQAKENLNKELDTAAGQYGYDAQLGIPNKVVYTQRSSLPKDIRNRITENTVGAVGGLVMQDHDVSDVLGINKYINSGKATVDDFQHIIKDVDRIYAQVKNQLPKGTKAGTMGQKLQLLVKHALQNQRNRSTAIINK